MISIENREAFARAEAKARQVRPHVHMVTFGTYEVTGSSGDKYTVRFEKVEGHWVASCTCPAHTKSQPAKPCYHLPSAYSAHRIQVYIRKQRAEEEHPLPVCECGQPGFAHFEGRWWCGECARYGDPSG